RGSARNVHQVGCLINGQAGEIAEFDQFGLGRLAGGESGQGLNQRQQVVLGGVRKGNSLLKIDAPASAAVALTLLLASSFHQNAAHGLGRGSEEVAATVPVLGLFDVHQAQVGLVD